METPLAPASSPSFFNANDPAVGATMPEKEALRLASIATGPGADARRAGGYMRDLTLDQFRGETGNSGP